MNIPIHKMEITVPYNTKLCLTTNQPKPERPLPMSEEPALYVVTLFYEITSTMVLCDRRHRLALLILFLNWREAMKCFLPRESRHSLVAFSAFSLIITV